MTVEFTLPDIGEGLHEAEVVTWLVAVGDTVERNQPFVEIMTDKSTVEMPAPAAGTVRLHGAAEGEMIQVGELLVVIEEDSNAPTTSTAVTDTVATDTVVTSTAVTDTALTNTAVPSAAVASAAQARHPSTIRRPKASPATRRLAAELSVDLNPVAGTGPGGRILADDVHAASASKADVGVEAGVGVDVEAGVGVEAAQTGASASTIVPPPLPASARASRAATSPPPDVEIPPSTGEAGPASRAPANVVPPTAVLSPGVHKLRGVRRATARAMDLSWSTIPHINASNEINAEHLLSTRAQLRALQQPDAANITPLVLALMAVARALRAHPVMNGALDLEAETITVHERINIGVAVSTDYGLVVPVIADADRLDVTAMATELRRLISEARDRSIVPGDLRGGTYTVTNFGSNGTHLANPIIRPGEAGICGLGSIAERPMVIDGNVVARPTLPVVVCGDHRLVDGDVLSSFHGHICRSLEAPLGLLL